MSLEEFFELWCNGDLEITSMTQNIDSDSITVETVLIHPLNYVTINGKLEI